MLIQDLPGVSVSASLQEGKARAETGLLLRMSDAPKLMGEVAVDNSGAHSTGTDLLIASVHFFLKLHTYAHQ